MISIPIVRRTILSVAALHLICFGGASPAKGKPFNVMGSYVEGCTCAPPCTCELTGVESGCQGVGFFQFNGGAYNGQSVAGTKAAYAVAVGQWVVIYIDAPDKARMKACSDMMRAALAGFGKIEAVKAAKISLADNRMSYRCTVNGGKTMALTTSPILGGDGKNPMVYANIKDPLHPVIKQGKTTTGSYTDGSHNFTLKDSNAFFNDKLSVTGRL